jgi:hypothetical protein
MQRTCPYIDDPNIGNPDFQDGVTSLNKSKVTGLTRRLVAVS